MWFDFLCLNFHRRNTVLFKLFLPNQSKIINKKRKLQKCSIPGSKYLNWVSRSNTHTQESKCGFMLQHIHILIFTRFPYQDVNLKHRKEFSYFMHRNMFCTYFEYFVSQAQFNNLVICVLYSTYVKLINLYLAWDQQYWCS